jgi:hypothetical protein
MRPHSTNKVTIGAVAPFLRRLRSGTSQKSRLISAEEVLPHNYGTNTQDPSRRDVESLHSETHAGHGTDPPPAVAGCLGRAGVDGEQFGHDPGTPVLRRATPAGVDSCRALSVRRAGDCARQSVGEEEAGVVTGNGKRKGWGSVIFRGAYSCNSYHGPCRISGRARWAYVF